MFPSTPRRIRPRAAVALAIAALCLVAAPSVASAQTTENLRSYYPNVEQVRAGYYLEGFNYVNGGIARSVLWFEDLGRGRFRQYNSAPDDPKASCHWDQLRWRRGVLRYEITNDACGADTTTVTYSPAITLMPETWDPGSVWATSGTSRVTVTENGRTACRGLTSWTATVDGYVEIAPGVQAVHVRSTQVTDWTSGRSSSGCAAGFVTEWQEDYYLMPDMPVVGGGTAPAFKRSVGGNLAGGPDRWDVWFDRWQPLPT